MFHKLWLGFFIVGILYSVIGGILIAMRKKIIAIPILNLLVEAFVGAALKAENKIEEVQEKIEDKLHLEHQ